MSAKKMPARRPAESARDTASTSIRGGSSTSEETTAAKSDPSTAAKSPDLKPALLEQYGCGPVPFASPDQGLYDRHLLFDNVIDPVVAGARARFEAFARSVRDVLSQRWVRTEA